MDKAVKAAFGKCGVLMLNGEKLEGESSLEAAGIKENSQLIAFRAAVSYKEKRDLLVQNFNTGNSLDKFRFVSLDVPIKSITVHYSADCYGLTGFEVNLEDGTKSELLGKVGNNSHNRTTKELILNAPHTVKSLHPNSCWHGIGWVGDDGE